MAKRIKLLVVFGAKCVHCGKVHESSEMVVTIEGYKKLACNKKCRRNHLRKVLK